MRYALLSFAVLLMFTTACHQSYRDYNEIIDLSGIWKFKLDPDNIGMKDLWFSGEFNDSIPLPGTTDEHKKGTFIDEQAVDRLSRVWYWKGAAWYQKDVEIPESWAGKNVKLLLERTKDTHVWFDDIHCGYENTLSAYQYFDLTKAIKPGLHKVTVLVDNAKLPPVGPSHAVDERTQTNWNGIVGRIELQATDPVWMEEVQLYPDVKNNRVKIRVSIGNITGSEVKGELVLAAESWNTVNSVKFQIQKEEIAGITKDKLVEFTYDFNKEAPLWDEFDPALIKLSLTLSSSAGDENYTSSKQVDFGMREFKREGKYILLNGDRVFLRGRIDCANYPITGYPPMEKTAWLKLFRQLKSYGINHWRFHSWCPPKEALMAADELGVYLQPELPNKRSGMDKKSMDEEDVRAMRNIDYLQLDTSRVNMTLKDYLQREGELIFKYFGNHPSFTMFTLGNELGRNPAMYKLVADFKELDPRRLYAQGSNTMHWDQSFAEGDDFWICAKTGTEHGPVRGAYFHLDYANGHIENFPPSTLVDYSASIIEFDVPVVAHENGAHQVSPDFTEIPKYTGVTRARNYEIFRERLINANMLDQADDFVKASGKLAVICYREEIEAALRTRDFAGFQLLDIQDFPGQGTAPVGILNDFMESKGLITPEKWRQFCSEVVPLLKMSKYTWTNDEEFSGDIEIAHYGKEDFRDAEVSWKLANSKGEALSEGIFTQVNVARGGVSDIGEITTPLKLIEKAEKLKVVISLEGTGFKNEYDIWVYPKAVDTSIPEGILVSEYLDSKTKEYLQSGGKAIIIPNQNRLHCIKGAFKTDYWSPMFAQAAIRKGFEPAPGSMGFICDPDSPLFEHFPTEFHSNWQWWQLVKNCKPIILDETPADYKPMVQTIDNFARNHKMGMIFETKYGKGSVLICAIDLLNLQDKPEARQLYYSILNYVKSDDFVPEEEFDKDLLHKIIP
ncbi:MAG: beta-galactosidase [Bacteroidetes bacterium]|nr:beta-galactosidase [Bacteroidota bacterium]